MLKSIFGFNKLAHGIAKIGAALSNSCDTRYYPEFKTMNISTYWSETIVEPKEEKGIQ